MTNAIEIWGKTRDGRTVLITRWTGYYEDAKEYQDELMKTGDWVSIWFE